MIDTHTESSAESTDWTEEPREGASVVTAFVGRNQPIVPPAWRSEFLAERWIAGRACAVQPSDGSTGLIVDVSFSALDYECTAHYHYDEAEDALLALRDWDGRLDPPGPWIKERISDRRGPGAAGDGSSS